MVKVEKATRSLFHPLQAKQEAVLRVNKHSQNTTNKPTLSVISIYLSMVDTFIYRLKPVKR